LLLIMPATAFAQSGGAEKLPGKCVSSSKEVSDLFALMDYRGSISINCDGVELDWARRIAFLRDGSRNATLAFEGRPDPSGNGLLIDSMIDFGLEPTPAKGRCRTLSGSNGMDRRTLVCFASFTRNDRPMAVSVRFAVDDIIPARGATVHRTGKCRGSEAMDVILQAMLEREASAEVPMVPSSTRACDTAISIAGSRTTFSVGAEPDSQVVFAGEPGERDGLLSVKTIAFGRRAPLPVDQGSCIDMRKLDGSVATVCGVAYREGGAARRFSIEFVPGR
jgi:hypothetical protein